MDARQRLDDLPTAIAMRVRNQQARMWTALPGIIQSYNPATMTAEVVPAIQGVKASPTSADIAHVDLPLLVDCPVHFQSAGGVSLTMPIRPGDECLVIFASRCIDAWWQQGGVQPPMTYRMHNLSDGFCIPGVKSQPNVLSSISTTTAQLRSDDGTTFVEIDPAAQKVRLVAPGGIDLIGPLNLGGEGGPAIARVGDTVSGGVITSGSEIVKSV